jgi:hypothetical protein
MIRSALPTRSLALLMSIGFLDLIVTALLHERGLIVEMNPLMQPLIQRSEWLFAVVKAGTLIAAWFAMASYARTNVRFVRNVCFVGSLVYVAVWIAWFLTGR